MNPPPTYQPWNQVAALVLETQAALVRQVSESERRQDGIELQLARLKVWTAVWCAIGSGILMPVVAGLILYFFTRGH